MEHGKHVVEEVFHAHAETVEVALRGRRDVGNALHIGLVGSKAGIAEPGRNIRSATIHMVYVTHV